jgi:hypothetical protein
MAKRKLRLNEKWGISMLLEKVLMTLGKKLELRESI